MGGTLTLCLGDLAHAVGGRARDAQENCSARLSKLLSPIEKIWVVLCLSASVLTRTRTEVELGTLKKAVRHAYESCEAQLRTMGGPLTFCLGTHAHADGGRARDA